MQAYVKPRRLDDGTMTRVRMPSNSWAVLPPGGAWVVLDEYWSRRLRDRDVVEGKPPPDVEAPEGVEPDHEGELTEPEPAKASPETETDAKRRGR